MSVEDKKLAEWRAKLPTKDDLWVREQANRQLQPNVRKRVAAEEELARRRSESELASRSRRALVFDKMEALDPWRVILGCLFELDSYDIPAVIDRTGMVVVWTLTDRQDYSHKYRRAAYRPRIDEAYQVLSKDDRLRVSFVVVAELVERGMGEKLDTALRQISWCIDSGQLVPADESVRELFFPQGSQHDAYVEIRGIVRRAKSALRVIDSYLDGTIFTILSDVQGPLKIHLLTAKPPTDFVQEATKFRQQYQSAQIEIRRSKDFHDRFIIVDEKECWHIGCSIKDAGNRAFMLNHIEDRQNCDALIAALNKTWSKASRYFP